MTIETFFEKFELFADAPDAIAKMRELVLDLAVQGRLVQQMPAEGDGHSLLRLIHQRNPPEHTDPQDVDAFEGELKCCTPSSWAIGRLGDVAEIVRGVTFPGSAKSKTQERSDVACLRTASVQAEIDWDDLIFISPTYVTRKDQWVAPNDIMISMANSFELVGKVAIVRHVPQKATFGAFLAAIRPILIEPHFLLCVLRSPAMQRAFRASSSQTTNIANISLGRMRPLELPVPPLAEQKRIVAKVDELMLLCDRLEAQQQQREAQQVLLGRALLARFADAPTSANLRLLFNPSCDTSPADLRRLILSSAVRGELVPHDAGEGSAEEKLSEVLAQRRAQDRSSRLKDPCPVQSDPEHQPPIPDGWCYASPDQLTAFTKNALAIGPFGSSLLKSDYTDSGVPLVFVRDIRSKPFGHSERRFISPRKAAELESHTVRGGDLLITKMGDPPGDTAIYPDNWPHGVVTADCIKLSPHGALVSADYLSIAICSEQVRRQFLGITLGVAQPKVSLSRFREIAIPLPPLAEQKRIVAKVHELIALVDQLEAQLATAKAAAANLLAAAVDELAEQQTVPVTP